MNDFEQVLIRLGLDAKAVESGLTRMTSYVKGWASNMASEIQSGIVGLVGVGFIMHKAEQVFETIKEKALLINRLSKETGVSTNMVQSMMKVMAGVGEGFDALTKPLGKFSVLIGQARQGIPDARLKLVQWGIATKETNWSTITSAIAIGNLAVQYDKLGSAEERAALLQTVYGKSWQAVAPIFEQGAKAVADMEKSSIFKMSSSSLGTISDLKKGSVSIGQGALALWLNGLDATIGRAGRLIGMFAAFAHGGADKSSLSDRIFHPQKALAADWQLLKAAWNGQSEAEKESNDRLEQQQDLLKGNLKIVEALNEQHKLKNELHDRTKTTVGALADRYAELRGKGSPHGLKSIYSVTPAMASAYQIRNLELDAEAANAKGNYGQASMLQSRADELRKNNQALKSTERDPMEQVRDKLAILTESLERTGALPVDVRHIASQAH